MNEIQNKILAVLKKQEGIIKEFSLRSLGDMIGVEHPQQIKHHLLQLEKRGLVKRDPASRILKLITLDNTQSPIVTIPIIGSANCGQPTLFAQQNFEGTIKISKRLIHNKEKNVFAIKAAGSSMNRANVNGSSIDDGDLVVIDGNLFNPVNGDYVLAVIDDFGVIKKFMRNGTNKEIQLISESTEEHIPIPIHSEDQRFIINGKVIYVIKRQRAQVLN